MTRRRIHARRRPRGRIALVAALALALPLSLVPLTAVAVDDDAEDIVAEQPANERDDSTLIAPPTQDDKGDGKDDTGDDKGDKDGKKDKEKKKPLPPAPVPPTPADLPAAVDPLPIYQGQFICSPGAKPGSQKFADLIRSTYGAAGQSVWIPRDCSVGGRSEHKEGRALDWMINGRDREQAHIANAFLDWLLATDENGERFAMARRLGVMYIGWGDRIWESYTQQWSELKGCFSKPDSGWDTYCHRDHIHISLSWDGAAGQTSYWGGSPTPPAFCDRYATSSDQPLSVGGGLDFVAATPVRLIDTRKGTGLPGRSPCRLTQASSGGTGAPVAVNVQSLKGSPGEGVRAVAVRITTVGSNSPATLRARTGGEISEVVVNGRREVVTILPVAQDGTVGVTTDSGATHVVVDLLGYFVRPADAGEGGRFLAHGGEVVYDTANYAGPLEPGEKRLVDVGIAASAEGPPAGVLVSMTLTGAGAPGTVVVRRSGDKNTEATSALAYRRGATTTQTVLAGLDSEGRLTLVNRGRKPVDVRIALQASAVRETLFGARFTPVNPTVVTGAKVSVPRLHRRAEGASAAVLQVAVRSGSQAGSVTFFSLARPEEPSLALPRRSSLSGLVVVPLDADGQVRRVVDGAGLVVDARLVGYLR